MEGLHVFFDVNKKKLDEEFDKCDDVKCMDVEINEDGTVTGKIYFVEEAVMGITFRKIKYGLSDLEKVYDINDMVSGVMNGNAILLSDSWEYGLKIRSEGYPGLGVVEAKNEQVIRGSNEGFSSSIKTNEVLVRKRIRSPELKIQERIYGVRSKTAVAVMYMDTIVRPELVEEIDKRIEKYAIDGFMDSGVIEQLTSEFELSPFPQYMTTERPDRAAQFLLNGHVVVLVDNSPVALVLPVNFSTFLKAADDYFNRWELVTLERILRYIAVFFACSLPGIYIAVINFHPEVLPVNLVEILIESREGIPYSAFVEVLIMEISFELIREAGVRIPGAMGNAIGIVGGLIVGSAAVEASIASPIVVIVVALTALCSFTIPNNEFSSAFRLAKYLLIVLSAFMGIYGYLLGVIGILIHLSGIENFGFAYIGEVDVRDGRDYVIRAPYKMLSMRPDFARKDNRRRMTQVYKERKNGGANHE